MIYLQNSRVKSLVVTLVVFPDHFFTPLHLQGLSFALEYNQKASLDRPDDKMMPTNRTLRLHLKETKVALFHSFL